MAVYKVPQDVEADDKLIGPFSFRQFIYLIIVAIAGLLAWVLSRIFIGLIIVPLPIILLFGALALPLRKDQPMETYLSAVVRFFLKPKKRLWSPDGTRTLVQIVAPKVVEEQRYKDITQDDAQSRFNYLAQVMDTRGWSTKGVMSANDALNDSVVAEATTAEDVLDASTPVSQDFNALLEQQEQRRRQDAMLRIEQAKNALAAAQQSARANPMVDQAATQPPTTPAQPPQTPPVATTQQQQPAAAPIATPATATTSSSTATSAPEPTTNVAYNPYPTMHQHVISPTGHPAQPVQSPTSQPPQNPPNTTVPTTISPDILNLANNNDLSISAIAHEAHRLQKQSEQPDQEVVITLR